MSEMLKLVELYSEIKSSDGKQLGVVKEIVGNEIAMDVYVGRRGIFILQKDMIGKIRKKTVYLSLTKKEFEVWWNEEGSKLEAEYLEKRDIALGRKLVGEDLKLLREEIRTAFESNFSPDEISLFITNNSCPYCGTFIIGKEQLQCSYCGLYLIKDDFDNYMVPEEQKAKLCREQEKLRTSLSIHVRNMLHFDEWVYDSVDLPSEENTLVVTSRRLIRFRPHADEKDNWEIPLENVTSVSLFQKAKPDWASGVLLGIWRTDLFTKLRIEHKTSRGLGYEQIFLPSDRYPSEKLESFRKYIEKAMNRRKIELGDSISMKEH